MYSDPSQIRDIVLKVRLNELEDNLIEAICKYTGQQKSSLIRELFLEQASLVLCGHGDIAVGDEWMKEPQAALNFS